MRRASLAERDALRAELLRLVAGGINAQLADDEFGDLALRIFRFQFAENAPYRAYCESRGRTPGTVVDWEQVPAVPTAAFRAVPLVTGDPAAVEAVFRTSGTTGGAARRGEHYVPDLALYHASLRAGFRAHLLPDAARPTLISLIPSQLEAPDSSLSHMVGELMHDLCAPGSDCFVGSAGLDLDGVLVSLRRASAADEPVCVLGTSFALVHLIDALRARGECFALPHGSRLMDTGGFKGRTRAVARDELYAAVEELLGIGAEWCVNEYGMTELGSQFYDTVAGSAAGADLASRLHRGPPWVRTRAVDPETLRLLPTGGAGILRHWDLVNLGSVMVVQTEDLGVCPEGGFRLEGRFADAEPRGCSLAMEELLDALERRG